MANGIPWLTSPAEQFGAMQAGARIGLARREEDQRQREAAEQLNLAYNQLARQAFESERQEKIRQQQLAATEGLRQLEKQRMLLTAQRNLETQRNAQAKLEAAENEKRLIQSDVTGFLGDITSDKTAAEALKAHPLAGHDPTIRSMITQGEIAKRTKKKPDADLTREQLIDAENIRSQIKMLDKEILKSRPGKIEQLKSQREDLVKQLKSLGQTTPATKPLSDAELAPFGWMPTSGGGALKPRLSPADALAPTTTITGTNAPPRLRSYNPDTDELK